MRKVNGNGLGIRLCQIELFDLKIGGMIVTNIRNTRRNKKKKGKKEENHF